MKSKLIIIFLVLLLFAACKSETIYVPVESVRTEYRDHYLRDSIHLYDSVFVKQASDTVFYERYRYLYKDKYVVDTIILSDSIRIPYPVIELKEVNKVTGFQCFQIWCGRILIILILGYFLIRYLKGK